VLSGHHGLLSSREVFYGNVRGVKVELKVALEEKERKKLKTGR
jgi:hypothetical protein